MSPPPSRSSTCAAWRSTGGRIGARRRTASCRCRRTPSRGRATGSATTLPNRLRGEAVQRRAGDAEHAEVDVDLPAMMDLVLGQRAQPLPDAELRAGGGHAFLLQLFVGEGGEDLHRLVVRAVEVVENGVVSLGELPAVSGIAARLELRVLGVHVQLDRGEVAEKIAEGELPFPVRPLDPVAGDEVDDVHRPLAKVRVVADELSDVVDFHRGAPAAILLPAP